ncbi:MAG: hypothetical protein M3068_01705 [Gemmatimonadota bacterium]|nr:hypothetical protein [Gemmatimonadota bacterium]
MLRHTVATLAYRGAKVVRGAPSDFAVFRCGETTRTPGAILAHIGDLLDWALALARGAHIWHDSAPLPWEQEVERFFRALAALDARLASATELGWSAEELYQGPIADALTHVGQLALLRRLAGSPVRGESYLRAEIVAGRVGLDQAPPRREFD